MQNATILENIVICNEEYFMKLSPALISDCATVNTTYFSNCNIRSYKYKLLFSIINSLTAVSLKTHHHTKN